MPKSRPRREADDGALSLAVSSRPIRTRRRLLTLTLGVAAGLAVAALATPIVLLRVGRDRSKACLARVEQPRGGALPACGEHARWFTLPDRAPWTRRWAAIYREELVARMAMARYVDAAVGTPSRQAQQERFEAVKRATQLVEEGTGRVRLSQLGPTIGGPEPGRLAFVTGDRATLIERGLEWTQWYTSNHAMEAALLHGDLPRAIRLAEHYAGRPAPDLRLHVAALLCLGGKAVRGLEQVQSVEQSRAAKRNANMSRNFGEARVLVEECARRAGVERPSVPTYSGAGEWDQRERHAVMRLRHAQQHPGCGDPQRPRECSEPEALEAAAEAAMNLLGSGMPLEFRLELSAAMAPFLSDGTAALELMRHREGEPTPLSRTPLTIRRLVERDAPGQPIVHPDRLSRAADHLLSLAPHHAEIEALAGAMLARAAAGYAAVARLEPALERAQRAAPLILDDEVGARLLESSVAFIGGDTKRGIAALKAALAPRRGADPVVAAARIQLAELLAAAGQHAEALVAAERADEVARKAGHPILMERAAWVRLALEGRRDRQRRGDPANATPPSPAPPPRLGPPTDWISDETRLQTLASLHRVWRGWLADQGPSRIAHRYAAYRARGDAPEARIAHLFAAGLLVDSPDEVEPWLDAFYALDSTALSLRGYAFARAGAARWRGDDAAARLWLERYRTLEGWLQQGDDAELFRRLRL